MIIPIGNDDSDDNGRHDQHHHHPHHHHHHHHHLTMTIKLISTSTTSCREPHLQYPGTNEETVNQPFQHHPALANPCVVSPRCWVEPVNFVKLDVGYQTCCKILATHSCLRAENED